MTGTRLSIPSIEDYLGPGEHRFFGGGFRKVRQHLHDIKVVCRPEAATIGAKASVSYPPDWSAKGTGTVPVAHLSTIDALLLGARLAELLLVHAYGLDSGARPRMWLRRALVRAGAGPQEELTSFAVRTVSRPAESVPVAEGLMASRVQSRIGAMTVLCEVQHEATGRRRSCDVHYPDADQALGPPARQYYADLFRHRNQRIEDVVADVGAGTADARVRMDPAPGEALVSTGLEASYAPSASMVDAITVMGQLVQVLLYELDGIERSSSNTLWLRRAELSAATPSRPLDGPMLARTRIARNRMLAIADTLWRVCELDYEFHGITGTYSVAHQLPERGL